MHRHWVGSFFAYIFLYKPMKIDIMKNRLFSGGKYQFREDERMKKVWRNVGIFVSICFACMMYVQPAMAASKDTTGMSEYDNAYEVLEIVNRKRVAKGLEEVVMDQDLLDAAMLRAAEISVKFSHIRPNGAQWNSVCKKMNAENIAYGADSPSAVMNSWMKSGGHRDNILNADYQSVGIGVFYKNGVRYWTQCYSLRAATPAKRIGDRERTYRVSMTSGVETKIIHDNPFSAKVSGVKVKAGKRTLTVTWKEKSGADGYQIQIARKKSFSDKKTYTVDETKLKKVITKHKGKKLASKKRYYIRIRAYKQEKNADGTLSKQYSKWKVIKKKTK